MPSCAYVLFTQGPEFDAVRAAFRLLPEGSHLAGRHRLADTVLPRVSAEIERKVADTLGGAHGRAAAENFCLGAVADGADFSQA